MSAIITQGKRFVLLLQDKQFGHKQHFKMEDKLFTSL